MDVGVPQPVEVVLDSKIRDALDSVIDSGITYTQAIGVLEIIKQDLIEWSRE